MVVKARRLRSCSSGSSLIVEVSEEVRLSAEASSAAKPEDAELRRIPGGGGAGERRGGRACGWRRPHFPIL